MNREDYVKLMSMLYDFQITVDDFNGLNNKGFDDVAVILFLEELVKAGYDESEEYKNKMEDILAKRTEISDYAKWREFENEAQDGRINEVIDGLEMLPTKWTVDFEEFNMIQR